MCHGTERSQRPDFLLIRSSWHRCNILQFSFQATRRCETALVHIQMCENTRPPCIAEKGPQWYSESLTLCSVFWSEVGLETLPGFRDHLILVLINNIANKSTSSSKKSTFLLRPIQPSCHENNAERSCLLKKTFHFYSGRRKIINI